MGENVIVCGGRDFKDRKAVFGMLDAMPKITLVVSGAARGADTLADEWAQARGVARIICPANWDGEGRAAGYWRNERMARNISPIHRVIAFPGGRGTENMVDIAKKRGIPVTFYTEWRRENPSTEELLS